MNKTAYCYVIKCILIETEKVGGGFLQGTESVGIRIRPRFITLCL